MSFDVPEHVRPLRARVQRFIEERVYPAEAALDVGDDAAHATMHRLMGEAKSCGLWALGHPKEIGGGGLPFLDYVYVKRSSDGPSTRWSRSGRTRSRTRSC